MTEPPAVEHSGHVSADTEHTRALRAEMVDQLVRDGALTDEQWTRVFREVPRHVLVPDYYEAGGTRVDGQAERDTWLRQVYSDTTLITQRQHGAPTSSGTMPSLVATMLHALDVEDGHRVLQVATGTGYTAALLCERLGSANVTSIDIDPDLTAAAWERLCRCGYEPTIVTGDGAQGYARNAPYDRAVVTFGVTRVPYAWIEQTRTGGVIVAPVCSALARLAVTGPGRAEGRFIGPGYFIRHRKPTMHAQTPTPAPLAQQPRWPERTTDLPSGTYYNTDFRFILSFTHPDLAPAFRDNPRDLTVVSPDGSHAHITPRGHLTQTGSRRVWEEIERTHRAWQSLGAPARERYGLTVTAAEQYVWLDDPDGPHRWPL